jgi:SagB-type dehydrogenase family enzyme
MSIRRPIPTLEMTDLGPDLPDGGVGDAAADASLSELFHENSKQRRHDVWFGARIAAINNNPAARKILSAAAKRYPGAVTVALPGIIPSSGISFEEAVARRRSLRTFTGEPLRLEEVAKLLHFGNGITDRKGADDGHDAPLLRAAPSGGALYPVELYAAISAVEDLTAGLYHYRVPDHILEQLQEGDLRHALGEASSYKAIFAACSMSLIMTITPPRSRFKYGDRGYRFALLEAGHVAENILLCATSLGLGAVAVGGFIDDEVAAILDVDGVEEAPVYLIPVGRPGADSWAVTGEMLATEILKTLWREAPPEP